MSAARKSTPESTPDRQGCTTIPVATVCADWPTRCVCTRIPALSSAHLIPCVCTRLPEILRRDGDFDCNQSFMRVEDGAGRRVVRIPRFDPGLPDCSGGCTRATAEAQSKKDYDFSLSSREWYAMNQRRGRTRQASRHGP